MKPKTYFSEWLECVSTSNSGENLLPIEFHQSVETEDLLEDSDVTETPGLEEVQLSHLHEYEEFIEQSDAYQWLLTRLSQYLHLVFTGPDIMSQIGDRVLDHLHAQGFLNTMSRSGPRALACMTFHLK